MTRAMERLAEMEGTPPTFEELERLDKVRNNGLDPKVIEIQKDINDVMSVFYSLDKLSAAFGAKRMPEDSDEPLPTL